MKLEIALAIPGALQRLMIQDWERINKLSQVSICASLGTSNAVRAARAFDSVC